MSDPILLPDPGASLFTNRVPEAAARQLAIVLAWLAEEQLETLERLERASRSTLRELKRQREIVKTLVDHCADLGVPPRGLRGIECPRLAAALQAYERERTGDARV